MNIFDTKHNLEWRDYLKILKRRKWYFITSFLLVLSLGGLKLITTQPIYESSCAIQIKPSRLLSSSLQRVVPGVIGNETMEAMKKQILSSEYLIQLINLLELRRNEKIQEKATKMHHKLGDKSKDEIMELLLIDHLRKVITVRQSSYDIIEIKAQDKTPELSYLIVQKLTETFIDEALRNELGKVQNALRFNDEQIVIFKEKLDQAEKALENYKEELISNRLGDQNLTNEAMTGIREAIVAIEIASRERQDYKNYIESQLEGENIIEKVPENFEIRDIRVGINEKIGQMAQFMERYTWKSAEVIMINREIKSLRDKAKTLIEKSLKRVLPDLSDRLLNLYLTKIITDFDSDILDTKREALIHILERFKQKAVDKPSIELTLSKLEEEVEINRRIYNMFLEQNQGAQIEESMQRIDAESRFKIIEPALKPLEPINAGYRMILFVTVMIGTGLGVGTVYLREYLDQSIRTVQEAEDFLGIPVIGVLPNFDEPQMRLKKDS